jgi:CubicO group peptidase (beta-lactamase class C family)
MLPPTVVKYIHERIAAGLNPSIAVGIITKDGPQYFSFGKKKWKGKKVNEHTIYEIGSITKVFTAILLADMHLKGELNIEDPVSKFLPAHVRVPSFNGQQITLGHLSDHTSSLPRVPDNLVPENYMNPYADYSVEDLYAFLSSY